jgi:hypothetical protein
MGSASRFERARYRLSLWVELVRKVALARYGPGERGTSLWLSLGGLGSGTSLLAGGKGMSHRGVLG